MSDLTWFHCDDSPPGVLHLDLHLDDWKDAFLHVEGADGDGPVDGDYFIGFNGVAVVGDVSLRVGLELGSYADLLTAEGHISDLIQLASVVLAQARSRHTTEPAPDLDPEMVAACTRMFIEVLDQIPVDVIRRSRAMFQRVVGSSSDIFAELIRVCQDGPAFVEWAKEMIPDELVRDLMDRIQRIEAAIDSDRDVN